MANVRTANSFHVDATGTLLTCTGKPVKVTHITTYTTAGNQHIQLTDGGVTKVTLSQATAYASQVFDFSANPIVFQTNIAVSSINLGGATILFTQD